MNTPNNLFSTLKLILLSLILFTFIFLFINLSLFDEKLNPEIENILQDHVMPAKADNIYFAMMDIAKVSNKQQMNNHPIDNSWEHLYKRCNSRENTHCVNNMTAQLIKQPIKNEKLQLLLERYRQLYQLPVYVDQSQISHNEQLPPFELLMQLNQILIANSFINNDAQTFSQLIKNDINFWRKILSESKLLLTQMVATAVIRSDLDFLSASINSMNYSKQELNDLLAITDDLNLTENNLNQAFKFEHRPIHHLFDAKNQENFSEFFNNLSFIVKWTIQPNATSNTYYEHFTKPLAELSEMSANDFYQTINSDSYKNKKQEIKDLISFSPSILYNLGGKKLVISLIGKAEDYIKRIHDLNGMLRLTRLKIKMAENNLNGNANNIEAFIHQSGIKVPYKNESMKFNKKDNKIYFNCLDQQAVCSVAL